MEHLSRQADQGIVFSVDQQARVKQDTLAPAWPDGSRIGQVALPTKIHMRRVASNKETVSGTYWVRL